MQLPFLRRAVPTQQPPPPGRHQGSPDMFWLVTGAGDTLAGAPFPDREIALEAFDRHAHTFGNAVRARVLPDKAWRIIQRQANLCPGSTWAELALKAADPQPALCGRAWPHRSHPLAAEPVGVAPVGVAPVVIPGRR